MKINNQDVVGKEFVYDGCHKIYIIEKQEDLDEAIQCGYENKDTYSINELKEKYDSSCDLRFIHNWALDKTYASQDTQAIITN